MFKYRRPLRLRLAIFAMLALLWSQTALAWHGLCLDGSALAQAGTSMQAMAGHASGCHEDPPKTGDALLCAAHCDQGVPSPDIARIPLLPLLPALVPEFTASIVEVAPVTLRQVDSPPPIPWKRPTAHPAAILLI